ncbi:N-acetylmuramoyl-L-alanine amidase [Clostridium aestuarii]|uniref:N-acetylmuramoyl-L-alanine amidase n=1 Tax=Clostridium aestuarii TaxID=338193 RepID=A0ABT4D185_9CLOT|nr:N-acetylmuramoyl-L-alanine amidase [Clostridium aestuarii]MCY6484986.1 N-acetylmuramoyl-L-alanine amidase [Clostridium aestuarii]
MRCVKRIVIFMVMMLFIGGMSNLKAFGITYNQMQSKFNIDIDKVWDIEFNEDIDRNSVLGQDNIIVLDDENNNVKIKVGYKDSRTISVSPVYHYEYGKTYMLIIRQDIKSKKGKTMLKPVKMKFTIKSKVEKPVSSKENVVVLDAGRAGNDIGAEVGPSGIKGKDINLDVAIKAGKILESNGVKVVYTRKTDYVSWSKDDSIEARSKIVNDANADVLVSIHCNSSNSKDANGIETYYLENDSESKKLASYIQNDLVSKTGLRNRGIMSSRFKTLSKVNATAVYLDLGFITNPTEEKVLNSEEFKKNSAEAIANLVLKYLDVKRERYIKDIKDKTVLLFKGEKYNFPHAVTAVMNDNTNKNVSVKWDKNYINTSKAGTYTYKGTINGYDDKVSLTIIVSDDSSAQKPIDPKQKVICIDSARGGSYIGVTGVTGVKEKDINLKVGLKAGKILEEKGYKVIYTRKSDSMPWSKDRDIEMRDKIANDGDADLFISIHCLQSTQNPSATGVQAYYLNNDNISKQLANDIQSELIKNTGARDRGIQGRDLRTLKNLEGTGMFIYLGFLTNSQEEKLLNSESYQDKCAKAIADGIINNLNSSTSTDVSINSVQDITVNLLKGQEYLLPKKVDALTSGNRNVKTDVVWAVNNIDTSKLGTYVIPGRVKGYNKTVTLVAIVGSNSSNKKYKICIDPGHGGYDSGAVGTTGIKEKDVALGVSLKLGDILVKNGLDVVFTRTSDNTPWPADKSAELKKRCSIANTSNVDYFVSIHANSTNNRQITGTEVLYYRDKTDGIPLARNIQDEMITATGNNDRGLKPRGIYVTKYTNAPSALVELEFISNPEKEKMLNTSSYQQKCAEAIARGILKTVEK